MTTSEIQISDNVWWSSGGGQKEGGEHGGSSTTNCAIHGENNLILDWTKTTEASGNELPHGVGYGTNDQSNEPVKPPSTVAKD